MFNSLPIDVVDPLSCPGYEELLSATPEASFFHSSAWASVLRETYGFRPRYLATMQDGHFGLLMPLMHVRNAFTGNKGVGLPFTDECMPLLNESRHKEALMESLICLGRRLGWKSVEWRGGQGLLGGAVPALKYLGHWVDLAQGEERLLGSFRDSTRRNVKKAQREGVEARVEKSGQAMRVFYGLQCLIRKKHGLPPQPLGFFLKLWEHAVSRDKGFLVLAYHRGTVVSGAVFLHLGPRAIFKYGASAQAAEPLRANNLVMWEGMRECMRRGCSTLSLGRTHPGNTGLLQFKRGWASLEAPIDYYRYDLKTKAFTRLSSRETGWHSFILSRFPLPVLRLLGSVLYPYMA
ncbi:MAG: GNAT family N-acetyltransferase [bacterium]